MPSWGFCLLTSVIREEKTRPVVYCGKPRSIELLAFVAKSPLRGQPHTAGTRRRWITTEGGSRQRPVCFVFAGHTDRKDGSDVHLTAALLQDSVNYQQMLAGYAYPLYYNTLFTELRNEFNQALSAAKQAKRGYWPKDKTIKGVTVKSKADLATIKPVWPKLWRRLEEYFRKHDSLASFVTFLAKKNERLDVLAIMEERGLQDVVKVSGNKVKLTEAPENLRVRGKAGKRK